MEYYQDQYGVIVRLLRLFGAPPVLLVLRKTSHIFRVLSPNGPEVSLLMTTLVHPAYALMKPILCSVRGGGNGEFAGI